MTIYEVTITVHPDAADQYANWLRDHIQQIVQLPMVLRATWSVVEQADGNEHRVQHCVHYFMEDRKGLEQYLQDHAPALRQEGIQLFGGKFTATRRVMEVCQQFHK